MPVSLNLNSDQLTTLGNALKGKNILEIKSGIRFVTITRENLIPLKEALEAFHAKRYKVKTKTVLHLEDCYYTQQILEKLYEVQRVHFPTLEANEALDELVEETEQLDLYDDNPEVNENGNEDS